MVVCIQASSLDDSLINDFTGGETQLLAYKGLLPNKNLVIVPVLRLRMYQEGIESL